MRRGEIWWANLAAPVGPRSVVLLSRDAAYDVRQFVTISTVSTRIRGIPAEVSLGSYEGLSRQSAVNLDVLYTVPVAALRRRVGAVSSEKMAQIDRAIHFALGLDD